MKKFFSIALVAAAMLFAGKANAQISIHGGYQNETQKVSVGSGSESISGNGFYIGGNYNMEAGAGLGVAPGVYFAYSSYSIKGSDESFSKMDIRIPVLLNWGMNMGEIGVGLFGGPMVNIGVGGDAYKDNSGIKNFGLGVTLGIKASYQKISLDLGYNLDLLNRWKDAPDDCSVKFNQFFVGLGYSL